MDEVVCGGGWWSVGVLLMVYWVGMLMISMYIPFLNRLFFFVFFFFFLVLHLHCDDYIEFVKVYTNWNSECLKIDKIPELPADIYL